jgi:hypothetical protein
MGRVGRVCVVAAGLFLGWILVQALNPSHVLVPGYGASATSVGAMPAELAQRPHAGWLPSGLATPFDRLGADPMPHANAWRQLLIFGAVAAFGGAMRTAVNCASRARRALEWGVVHAVVFSGVALAHTLSGSGLTYWKYYDPVYRLGGPQSPTTTSKSGINCCCWRCRSPRVWGEESSLRFRGGRGGAGG